MTLHFHFGHRSNGNEIIIPKRYLYFHVHCKKKLFTIAKVWKHGNSLNWIKKMWYIYTHTPHRYYSTLRGNFAICNNMEQSGGHCYCRGWLSLLLGDLPMGRKEVRKDGQRGKVTRHADAMRASPSHIRVWADSLSKGRQGTLAFIPTSLVSACISILREI